MRNVSKASSGQRRRCSVDFFGELIHAVGLQGLKVRVKGFWCITVYMYLSSNSGESTLAQGLTFPQESSGIGLMKMGRGG